MVHFDAVQGTGYKVQIQCSYVTVMHFEGISTAGSAPYRTPISTILIY